MGTHKCYWEGGPLDLYRRACLSSYGMHGFSVELYTNRPPKDLPAGVIAKPLAAVMRSNPLEAHLIQADETAPQADTWKPLDVLRLQPDIGNQADTIDHLAWIEAFKLWLPEYHQELSLRSRDWSELPLHLSFAAMAGLDLHCLPPMGSFLADLLARQQGRGPSVPTPHHLVQDVQQSVQRFLRANQSWGLQPLEQLCGQAALKSLGVIVEPPLKVRLKRSAKALLKSMFKITDRSRIQ